MLPVKMPDALSSKCRTQVFPEPGRLARATIGLLPREASFLLLHISMSTFAWWRDSEEIANNVDYLYEHPLR